MKTTQPSQLPRAPELGLLHTECGFDLIADPADYVYELISRDGMLDAPETDLLTRILRPGDICVDAGCQIGYYSCLLAQLVGQKGSVYAFDADPRACRSTQRNLIINRFSFAEVNQAALGDRDGRARFRVSTDYEPGSSSLGAVSTGQEVLSVYSQRLETFLNDQHIDNVRLLKLDVGGAEELVLRGLGQFLAAHAIDFILLRCVDERLQLFNSSTETVSSLLISRGYACWEYGTNNSVGWSRTTVARSRRDCHYLFASPCIAGTICTISLAPALRWTHGNLNAALKETVQKLQDDIDFLLSSIKEREELTKQLAAEKRASEVEMKLVFDVYEALDAEKRGLEARIAELEAVLKRVETSVSFRITAPLRKLKSWLAQKTKL